MAEENSTEKIINGVKSFINQIPSISYGTNAIQHCNIEGYGSGQAGFNQLQADLGVLDLSKVIESSDLDKEIKKQKKELIALEKQYASLVGLIGDDGQANEGTAFNKMVVHLEKEIYSFIEQRNNLLQEVTKLEVDKKNKIEKFNEQVEFER